MFAKLWVAGKTGQNGAKFEILWIFSRLGTRVADIALHNGGNIH